MTEKTLNGVRIAILATDGVEESELLEPRRALEGAGARTSLIAPKSGTIQAMKHDDKSQKIKVDLTLEQAKPQEFDGVLLPGGALNADALRMEERAREFVRQVDREGKPVAVICHGPWLLASAGLLRGRKLTSYHTIQDDLRNAGATWSDEPVVRDRNWVSSRQPGDLQEFQRETVALFSEKHPGKKAA